MNLNISQFLSFLGESYIFPGEASMLMLEFLATVNSFSFIALGEPVGVTFAELIGVPLLEPVTPSESFFFYTEACLSIAI